jgi:hypothetical protein
MSRQGEYTCIFEAEGGFFEGEIAFKSGHPDLFLKAFDMEGYNYSSNKAGKVAMRRTSMCITAFVQPDVLLKWYLNTKLRGRGMIQRFLVLFAYKPIHGFQTCCLPTLRKRDRCGLQLQDLQMLSETLTLDKNRETGRKGHS